MFDFVNEEGFFGRSLSYQSKSELRRVSHLFKQIFHVLIRNIRQNHFPHIATKFNPKKGISTEVGSSTESTSDLI